ncbi:hypothetical protein C7R88_04645 [Plesiomonas shigelloides]|uniref:hypothetical protein n=1 Tax=Plesiomonas shigelloides TaxID=703 RepID=UPI000D12D65F|nr:hypothetical protein [Plesiomonas shigelloides]AVQ86664.1 hypothetical protein C7R88_04645 [Plesiomonas shigelloides]
MIDWNMVNFAALDGVFWRDVRNLLILKYKKTTLRWLICRSAFGSELLRMVPGAGLEPAQPEAEGF